MAEARGIALQRLAQDRVEVSAQIARLGQET
jgi:hypothetical protein